MTAISVFQLNQAFKWYFAPIAIRSPPTILTSSRESLSSVIIVLIFASVSNVDTWRIIFSSFTVQPLSLTARASCCQITAAISFQFFSFKFATVFCFRHIQIWLLKITGKETISLTALRDLENSHMRLCLFPFFTGFSKGHYKASKVFLWHITHRFQSSTMFCGHKLKQITNFWGSQWG